MVRNVTESNWRVLSIVLGSLLPVATVLADPPPEFAQLKCPTPPTLTCPVPSIDAPCVEITGTSLGKDNIQIPDVHLGPDIHNWPTLYFTTCDEVGFCEYDLLLDGAVYGIHDFEVARDYGKPDSGCTAHELPIGGPHGGAFNSSTGLGCKHTLKIRATLAPTDGNHRCDQEYERVYVESNPITFWVDADQSEALTETMDSCTSRAPTCKVAEVARPVNIANGKMSHEMTDLRIESPLPIVFMRRYDSGNAGIDLGLGHGWQHNYMVRLEEIDSQHDRKTFVDENMRKISFNCGLGIIPTAAGECQGVWLRNEIDHMSLDQAGTGASATWVVTDKYKTRREFDGFGRLQAIVDRNGNTIKLHHEGSPPSSKLTSITDGTGRGLTLHYDDNGDPLRVTSVSGGGRTVTYDYLSDDLWKVEHSDNPNVPVVTYEYVDHRLVTATDANSHVIESHAYDGSGRVDHTVSHAGNYDYTMNYSNKFRPTVTNGRGVTSTFSVDPERGIALGRSGGPGCSSCNDSGDATTKSYDEYLNVTDVVDGLGGVTHMTYDCDGNVLSKTEGGNILTSLPPRTTTFTFNAFSLPETISVPTLGSGACASAHPNKVVHLEPDAFGNLVTESITGCNGAYEVTQTTQYTYDSHGRLLSVDGPRAGTTDVTRFEYYPDEEPPSPAPPILTNNLGRLKSITNAVNQTTHYDEYDYFGNPGSITDPNGVETSYLFNFRDQVSQRRIKGSTPASAPTVDDLVTAFDYDGAGNLLHVRLPECVAVGSTACPFSVQYAYDEVNRLHERRDAMGNRIVYTYDSEGNVLREEYEDALAAPRRFTNFAYDDFNRLQYEYFNDAPVPPNGDSIFRKQTYNADGTPDSERDPMGHVKTYTYDELKRLTAVSETVGTDTLTTAFEYDSQDNVTKVSSPRGWATTYTYGDLGWRLSTDSPDTGHTAYDYDAAGNLIHSTDAANITVTRTYDGINRLTSVSYPDTTLNVTMSYDAGSFGMGRRTGMSDAVGTTSYTYDRRGLLLSEQRLIADWSYETDYGYDKNGNLTQILYPASNTLARQGEVDYHYDDADRIDRVEAPIRGTTVTVADSVVYEPFGPRTQLTFGNGLTDTRKFDSRYQLDSWTLGSPTLGARLDYAHTFNDDGNLASRLDNVSHSNDRSFGYDEGHRLTTAVSPAWPFSNLCGGSTFTYDKNGNRLCSSESGAMTEYTYASGTNRLASATTGATSVSYIYDTTGNTAWDGVHSYGYNDASRLASVDGDDVARYFYDGDGRRVRKSTPAGTTYYFYDPAGHLLTELTPAESTGTGSGKDYIYANGTPLAQVDWLVAESFDDCPPGLGSGDCEPVVIASAELYYYHTDHLGTPIAMTGGDGSIVWRVADLPFGGGTPTGTAVNNLRFPGQYFDEETGLHQNWFRDYQPKTGRYQEADPIGLAVGRNLFGYADQNPVRSIDPHGLWGIQFGWNGWNLGRGDPTVVFTRDSWSDFGRGTAATADGVLTAATMNGLFGLFDPNPFSSHYDSCDTAFKWSRGLGQVSFGVATVAFLLPQRAASGAQQVVTHWGPAGMTELRAGDWVMTGGSSFRNWIMSGTMFRYPYSSSISEIVPTSALRAVQGSEWFHAAKTFIGQRMYFP